METSFNEFKRQVTRLDKKIEAKIQAIGNAYIINDGIVDYKQYFDSTPKILWILKEPYDDLDEDFNPSGGGWSMVKEFLAKDDFFNRIGRSNKTWVPIILTSYGILNNYKTWNEEVIITNQIAGVIKKIAMINVQKVAAFSSSIDSKIKSAYMQNKEVLFEQIKVYNPDIIIGGSTLKYFRKDLKIDDKFSGIDNDYFGYCVDGSKLYIDTYHPAQRFISKIAYANEIITVAKEKWAGLMKQN